MDVLGPILAIGSWVAVVVAVWRWGVTGLAERMQVLVHRIAHGPAPQPELPRVDYDEIARLERELFPSEESQ